MLNIAIHGAVSGQREPDIVQFQRSIKRLKIHIFEESLSFHNIAKLSQSSSSSWAEMAIFPANPATHPSTHPGEYFLGLEYP